jgi:hypothetical protein
MSVDPDDLLLPLHQHHPLASCIGPSQPRRVGKQRRLLYPMQCVTLGTLPLLARTLGKKSSVFARISCVGLSGDEQRAPATFQSRRCESGRASQAWLGHTLGAAESASLGASNASWPDEAAGARGVHQTGGAPLGMSSCRRSPAAPPRQVAGRPISSTTGRSARAGERLCYSPGNIPVVACASGRHLSASSLPSVSDDHPTPGLRFGDPRAMALLSCLCVYMHPVDGLKNRGLRAPIRRRPRA